MQGVKFYSLGKFKIYLFFRGVIRIKDAIVVF